MDLRVVDQMLTELPRGTIYVGFWKPDAECKCCQAIWPCLKIRTYWNGRYNLVNKRYTYMVPKLVPVMGSYAKKGENPFRPVTDLYDVVTGECWFMVPTEEEQVLDALARISS